MKNRELGKENKNRILSIIEAFLITFAIFNIGNFQASDILLGVIFAVLCIALYRLKSGAPITQPVANNSRANKIIAVVSAIWTISYLIYAGNSLGGGMENRLFVLIFEVLAAAGIFVGINIALRTVVPYLNVRKADYVEESVLSPFSIKKMLIYSAIVFVAMLPLFALNYPATMTVDSFDQLRQVRNMAAYSDHHPWVHTMIIKALYKLGYLISGSNTFAIAAYVVFQMIVTALSVGYAAAMVEKYKKSRIWSLVIILGYILYPYHLAYSITIWKDILFSDMVLVLTVTMYKLIMDIKKDNSTISVFDNVVLTISSIGMCLLRHNGLYAYIITALVMLIMAVISVKKKQTNAKSRLASLFTIIGITLCLVGIIKGPVQTYCDVEAGDYGHNVAIPLQQIARVINDGGYIAPEDMAELEKINTIIYIQNNYEPGGADNMIQWLVAGNSKYFEEHKLDYLGMWLRIGIKNPVSYFNGYFDQTKGYYTTMMPEQIAYYGVLPNEDGIETEPILGAGVRIKIDELCSKIQDMVPVYGIFYSMGACLLILILWMAVAMIGGRNYLLPIVLPVLTLMATILIATPLVADLRYAYPLMLAFPTLTAFLIGTEK